MSEVVRREDLQRHLRDLSTGTYEGQVSRAEKEEVYRKAVELLTPVAQSVLEEANNLFLNSTGQVRVIGPKDDGQGGLETRFELTWPEQRTAQIMRGPRAPLRPVIIKAHYGRGFLHPHLSGSSGGNWPLQILNAEDVERQRTILAAIVEMELHERIFETDWHILPISRQWRQDKS